MTKEEANKICAEFMGHDVLGIDDLNITVHNAEKTLVSYIELYTDSLDALVPVWGKLGISEGHFNGYRGHTQFGLGSVLSERSTAPTIQEAACIATAAAIKELK